MKRLMVLAVALALAGAASAGEWHIETVDSEGWVGRYTSLALDPSGYPHISYQDSINKDLKYARWNGSSWQIETVDSEGDVGRYTSLALDSSDRPHISYCDSTNYDLKYARWNGSSWQTQTVDSEGHVGWYTSLAFDSSDRPRISYYDMTNYALKYARWNGSSWQIETVDSTGDVGEYSSLALDSSDYPHISYYYASYGKINDLRFSPQGDCEAHVLFIPDRYSRGYLKYARWNGSSWQKETVDSTVPDVGMWTSLALDSSDRPHISYYHLYWDEHEQKCGALKYARWIGSSWQIETVDSAGDVGEYTSLALDSSYYPHISYFDVDNWNLKYARWNGSSWQKETVDATEQVGMHTSLALDSSDYPHISYFDRTNGYLKYAYWEGGPGVEDVALFTEVSDEGVLVGWTITGDVPAGLRVLRDCDEPMAVSGSLPGDSTRYLDRDVEPGIEYVYWLEVTDADGTVKRFGPTEPVSRPEQISRLALGEPYPSPAREAVTIRYELPNGCSGAVIEVYDLSGRRIDSFTLAPQTGRGEVFLEVSEYASGVYPARLSTDKGSVSRRLVITR